MNTRRPLQLLVLALGLLYVVMAIAGFATISDNTNVGGNLRGGNPADLLWGVFGVNTVLNFIHFLLGALTIGAAVTMAHTRFGVWTVLAGFVIVFGYDIVSALVLTGTDPLAINTADFWLHLGSLVVLLGAGLAPGRITRKAPSRGSHPR